MRKNRIVKMHWSEQIRDAFVKEAMLSDKETEILDYRIKKKTNMEIADLVGYGEDNVKKKVALIKDKYEYIREKYHPEWPNAYESKEEKYMNTH